MLFSLFEARDGGVPPSELGSGENIRFLDGLMQTLTPS